MTTLDTVLRRPLLAPSGSARIKALALRLPLTAAVVSRFVPGETVEDCLAAVRGLAANGLRASIDFLGEDTTSPERATAVRESRDDSRAGGGARDHIEMIGNRRSAEKSLLHFRQIGSREDAANTTPVNRQDAEQPIFRPRQLDAGVLYRPVRPAWRRIVHWILSSIEGMRGCPTCRPPPVHLLVISQSS